VKTFLNRFDVPLQLPMRNRWATQAQAPGYRRTIESLDRNLERTAEVENTRLAQLEAMEQRGKRERLRRLFFGTMRENEI
jgi:hypothetical protein